MGIQTQAPIDPNAVKGLIALDDTLGDSIAIQAKSATGALYVHLDSSDVSIAGGTEYTEDAVAATNPVGTAVNLIRTDTPATQVTTDGDNVAQRGTDYGAAYVQLVTSAGAYIDSVGGGTQYAVDAALGATPTGTLAVAIRDDALAALTPVEGDAIGLRVDANGALWVIPSGTTVVSATDLDIRNLTATDVVTANLSATDNAVLDDIALNQTDGTQQGMIKDGTAAILTTVFDYTNSNPLAVRLTNTDGDYVGAGAGTQYSDGDINADPTGTVAMGTDGSNIFAVHTDTSGDLQVDILNASLAVTGTFWQATQPVSIAGTVTVDLGVNNDVTLATLPDTAATDLALQTADLDTIAGDTTSIQTAVELLDNAVYIDDADWTDNTSSHLLVGGLYQSVPQTVTDGDVAPFNITANGALHISDAGGSLTVDASNLDIRDLTSTDVVTVTGGAGQTADVKITLDSESVAVTNAGLTALNGAITGTEVQVDVLTMPTVAVTGTFWQATQPVSLASVPSHAVTNAGTFAVQVDGDALTALQLIDDTVYSEDVATPATIIGNATVMERDDALATVTPIEADWIGLRGTAEGALWVQDFNSDAILADTTAILADTAAIEIATEATQAALETVGGLVVNLGVNNDVTVTGTVTANLSATDNAVLDAIEIDTTATATSLAIMDDWDNTASDGASISGDVAHDGIDAGEPVKIGGKALSASAAVAANDRVNAYFDLRGYQYTKPGVPEQDLAAEATVHVKKYYTNAGAVTDGIIWSPAAGKRWYITSIFIGISAAATVTLEDDLAGGDSAIWKMEMAANSGYVQSFPVPWYSGEDAADLIITTTAGNVYVTVVGYEI